MARRTAREALAIRGIVIRGDSMLVQPLNIERRLRVFMWHSTLLGRELG